MDVLRRAILKGAGATGALAAAAAAGLITPTAVQAADFNKAAFEAKTVPDALKALGAGAPADSKDIVLKAPDIAENGAVVPIEVTSNIPNTENIAVFADKNPVPLITSMDLPAGTEPYVSVRIKLGETSTVRAVVKAGGKYYATAKDVKVTVGGCGG